MGVNPAWSAISLIVCNGRMKQNLITGSIPMRLEIQANSAKDRSDCLYSFCKHAIYIKDGLVLITNFLSSRDKKTVNAPCQFSGGSNTISFWNLIACVLSSQYNQKHLLVLGLKRYGGNKGWSVTFYTGTLECLFYDHLFPWNFIHCLWHWLTPLIVSQVLI